VHWRHQLHICHFRHIVNAPHNLALQQTGLSVASLPLAPAAERRYVIRILDWLLPSWQPRAHRAFQTGNIGIFAPQVYGWRPSCLHGTEFAPLLSMMLRVYRSREVRRARGVTLVEVLIVVAIIALVSAGVAVAAFPYWGRAQQKSASANARNLRGAVKSWWVDHDPSLCPEINQLVQDQALDRDSPRTDPWGKPWRIECADHEVTILSDGSDRTAGTSDDIRIPPT